MGKVVKVGNVAKDGKDGKDEKPTEKLNEPHVGFKEVLAEFLELPKDVVLNLSKVVVYGNKGVVIENFVSITDYCSEGLILKTEKGIISVKGRNLVIKEIGKSEISISGAFHSIEFTNNKLEATK